jgi:hypothetical protein
MRSTNLAAALACAVFAVALDASALTPDPGCTTIGSGDAVAMCMNKTALPGYSPPFNGCGPMENPTASMAIGWVGQFGPVDFNPSCDGHDTCYGTCNSDKADCDTNFLGAMSKACADAYNPNNANPIPLPFAALGLGYCNDLALVYYAAVASPAGNGPFNDGQAAGCECCDQDAGDDSGGQQCVLCNCTGQVFHDAVTCVNNCNASLACFTGICEPTDCPTDGGSE